MSRRVWSAVSSSMVGLACGVLAAGSLWRGIAATVLMVLALLIRDEIQR